MPQVTPIDAPSKEVRDRIAVVTEEGLELEARVLAFARDAGDAWRAFDADTAALDGDALDRAAVSSGLGVLHALVERMAEALCCLVAPCDERDAA
jgi:hypothetical protein